MTDSLLSFGGIYLYQANSIFINHSSKEFLEEMHKHKSIKDHGKLSDWRDIKCLLTYRHEENHFLNFLISPYLSFVDYLNEYFGSQLIHLVQIWRRNKGDIIPYPLKEAVSDNFIEEEFKLNMNILNNLKRVKKYMLFKSIKLKEFIEEINISLKTLGLSKGFPTQDIPKITTKLNADMIIGDGKITVLNIVEALARIIEHYSLFEFRAKKEVYDDWERKKIFKQYKPAFIDSTNSLGWDLGALALNLSLKGKFFPYLNDEELFIEDFHPVLLYRRIVNDLLPFVEIMDNINNYEDHQEAFESITRALTEKYHLVTESNLFELHEFELNKNFHIAFPEIANNPDYIRSTKEKMVFQNKRIEYYNENKKNPLLMFQRPITKMDIYLLKDAIFSNNDKYLDEFGPITVYFSKLIMNALADYIVYNDDECLKIAEAVIKSIKGSYHAFNWEPREYLIKYSGLGIKEILF